MLSISPRQVLRLAASTLVALCCHAAGADASESAHASIAVRAEFSTRTSLSVSGEVLHFEVLNPAVPSTAHVEFSAAARTRAGGEVVLSVQPLGGTESTAVLGLAGESVETSLGEASAGIVAGRWVGSGSRRGTLQFVLRAHRAGVYTIPLRFVLSAP